MIFMVRKERHKPLRNCVLALDAPRKNHIWHFQTVHHDIWDYDLPAPLH